MEFKAFNGRNFLFVLMVDIGTEWNLKIIDEVFKTTIELVDIGTEWNLKTITGRRSPITIR